MLLANINLANTVTLTVCTCARAVRVTYVRSVRVRSSRKARSHWRVCVISALCSLLRCVGVVLQTYSAGSCGLLCKSGPHAVIRWFNIFLTKERVSIEVEDGTTDDCLKYLCKEYIFLVIRSSCCRYSTVSWHGKNKSSHVRDWRTLIQYNNFDEL